MRAKGAAQPETTAYYCDVCEQQALAIHVHEKGADEQAATARRVQKRISDLQTRLDLAVKANHTLRGENARLLALGQQGES